jgi:serine/threonine-protein kinase
MAVAWRNMPLSGAPLWPAALSTFLLPAIFFSFCALFPSGEARRRRLLLAAWSPAVFEAGGFAQYLFDVVHGASHGVGSLPEWYVPLYGATSLGYIAGGIGVLAWKYRRSLEATERRRLRLLLAGSVAGWAASIPVILLDWRGIASTFAPAFVRPPAAVAAAIVFLGCLFALTYAMLRRRVFGIGLLIRQGLRYALARRLLISLAPAAALVLIGDLVVHADQPLGAVLRARGWIYAGLGALALLARSRRQEWLDALDRRFFRERYDSQRLLRGLLEEIRRAERFESFAPRVVELIAQALHPAVAALLLREPDEPNLRPVAVAPTGALVPPFPAASKLMGLVRVLQKPIDIPHTTRGWLDEQLPLEETDFLRRTRLELLVPVATGASRGEALLALGAKRSEEPYSAEDRELLAAIAASLGLLLDRGEYVTTPDPLQGVLLECPECGGCYDSGPSSCPSEGAALEPRPVPRLVGGRYRLERRLGHGGMGAVYAATDVALERTVAAKLIHDDLMASPEAAERFRREARAAAAFTHPNIVTVHDFGMIRGRHAYLIMELLEGENLRETIRRAGRLPPERTLAILHAITDAVDAAHRRRLIHRDLKPENIFLARTESGEVPKVLDFGVAKSLHALTAVTSEGGSALHTRTGVLIGTLQYMSPEQLAGQAPEPSWDLWSLAVVAFEMLAGAHPFGAAGRLDWQAAVLGGVSMPVTAYVPEAPAAWQAFFDRALAQDPVRRPATARDFYIELDKAVSGGRPE